MLEIFNNTLLKIVSRRGSDADRKNVILDSGELGYATDTGRLFIGDGSTAGGILIGNKYKGETTSIVTLAPCEIGDYGYETTSESLYVLKENSGADLVDWLMVATRTKISTTSPFTLSGGELNLTVESPLYVDNNTLKIALSSADILDSSDVVNIIYPVDSIFFTMANVNPSSYFVGTTWAQISQGRFISGVGTGTDANSNTLTLSAGNNTGEYTHSITEAELPPHNHDGYSSVTGDENAPTEAVWDSYFTGKTITRHSDQGHSSRVVTGPTTPRIQLSGIVKTFDVGGGDAHNNTPPSFGLYVWRRLT